MKIAAALVLASTWFTCWFSYYGGRELVLPVLLPPGLFPALLTLSLIGYMGYRTLRDPIRLSGVLLGLGVASLSIAAILWPSFRGDGYFDMGRRAHVRGVMSAEAVSQLRKIVTQKLASNPESRGYLQDSELPAPILASPWRSPGFSDYTYDRQTGAMDIILTWGGALIFHHGIHIVDPPDRAPPVDGTYRKMEAWLPGCYIYNDWN